MDFSTNKLYIYFENDPWDVETLRKVIAEVESDPLNISEEGEINNTKIKIFDTRMKILLARIIFVILLTILNMFVLYDSGLNLVRTILYGIAILVICYDIF